MAESRTNGDGLFLLTRGVEAPPAPPGIGTPAANGVGQNRQGWGALQAVADSKTGGICQRVRLTITGENGQDA